MRVYMRTCVCSVLKNPQEKIEEKSRDGVETLGGTFQKQRKLKKKVLASHYCSIVQ